jgi:hypothetical protein
MPDIGVFQQNRAQSCRSSDGATLQRGVRIADIDEQRCILTVATPVERDKANFG